VAVLLPSWVSGVPFSSNERKMYTEPLQLWDAVITAISHRIKDGLVTTRIMVTATLNQDTGNQLDVGSLVFNENGTPKAGFPLDLSTGCAAFRALFEADPALKQSFELTGDATDNYVIERGTEGAMQLDLRLNHHGDPHAALAYVLAIGNGESFLTITPLQESLKAEDETTVTLSGPGIEPTMKGSDFRDAAQRARKGELV
jgi:hypothetical protein